MNRLIILLLIITSFSFAQKNLIEGFIKSENDGKPLAYANISILNKNLLTQSNEFGFFTLQGDFTFDDSLLVSHVGFETVKLPISAFRSIPQKEIFLKEIISSSQTILIKASIATEGISPISFAKVKKEELNKFYTTQDFPEALNLLPSINYYSENGNGIGYNYLSIRGFEQRRISVAINGVPQNDPEDHNVYWIDFPDLLENTDIIQVQRGAGSGIVGYPAIGGAINIITSSANEKAGIQFSSLLGSYHTRKFSVTASSGLISNHYSFTLKLSQLLSSGYRESSWTDLKSFHLAAVRYDDNLVSQLNIYGGPLADALAYTGLPKFAIKDRGLRKKNYSYWESDGKQFTYTVERRPEEIENFSQPHFELLNEFKVNNDISLHSTLFLILGEGFFDYDASWADTSYFRLTRDNGINATSNPTSALIRAMVNNKQWGWIPSVSIKHENGELILGGELRFHRSLHWGKINYANNLPENLTDGFRYYEYNGAKDIASVFLNENYNLSDKINVLIESQLAYHKYRLYNEKYIGTDFTVTNLFFNPRLGINYKYSPELNIYMTLARVSREPRLKNYYDAAESSGGEVPQFALTTQGQYDFNNPNVKPETMNNIEIGTSFIKKEFTFSLNGYMMLFDNEIVKKGQLDRFGQPITGNMDKTIHYGIESSVSWSFIRNFDFIFNGALSKNYIETGITYIKVKDASGKKIIIPLDLSGNTISGFPNSNFSLILRGRIENLTVQFSAKYVGKMYTDNYAQNLSGLLKQYPNITDYTDNLVDGFLVCGINSTYEFERFLSFEKIKLTFQINNLFDNLYAAHGEGGEFFPAAERNFIFGIKVSL